eukprot:6141143-Prymnesium_polylepis.2
MHGRCPSEASLIPHVRRHTSAGRKRREPPALYCQKLHLFPHGPSPHNMNMSQTLSRAPRVPCAAHDHAQAKLYCRSSWTASRWAAAMGRRSCPAGFPT